MTHPTVSLTESRPSVFDYEIAAPAPVPAAVELASGAVSVTPPAETAPTHADVLAFVDTLPARHRQWFADCDDTVVLWGIVDRALRHGREAS